MKKNKEIAKEFPDDLKVDDEENLNKIKKINLDEIDEKSENQSILSIVLSLIKHVGMGTDLTTITMPGAFILPESCLSFFSKPYALNFDLLLKANEIDDKQERFFQVFKYIMTTRLVISEITKKPLNPILGETFKAEVHFDESDQNCKIFAEQISHHPPISCFSVFNKEAGVRVNFGDPVVSTFLGTYIRIHFKGNTVIHLDKFNEIYTISSTSIALRLVRNFSEFVGTSEMTVNTSALRAKLTHNPKPLLFGSYNTIDAVFYNDKEKTHKVNGQWTGVLKISEYKKDEYLPFFDRDSCLDGKIVLPVDSEKLPTDSTFVWKGVFDEAAKGSAAKHITKEKSKVEEEQRKIASDRKKSGETWEPHHFGKDDNGHYFLKNY